MGVFEIALVTGALLLFALLFQRLKPSRDAREPPYLPPIVNVPLIGHLLGMLQYGHKYYSKVGGKNPPPIFTIDMFFTRTYIVTSPKTMQSVQRNSKIISFEPLLTPTASRIAGVRGPGLELLKEKEAGGHGVSGNMIHAMHPTLQGPGLDRMNKLMITYVKVSIDELDHKTEPFDIFMWSRHAISIASTDAVYGPMNPYREPKVEQAFWDWEMNLAYMMPDIYQSITARKPFMAREQLVKAIENYFEAGGVDDSSELTVARYKEMKDGGLTSQDSARVEAAMAFGLLTNSVPSTFFMLFDIYSRPSLLEEIRAEIAANALKVEDREGKTVHVVDLAFIRDSCPHFLSTFQEMLRLRVNSAPTRSVIRDMMLDDQYLLKQGSLVQMPSMYFNRQENVWGEDANEFNSKRFLSKNVSSGRTRGFLSFGTTPNICPGRHFASGEILALTAMILLRFDVTPVGGEWKEPKTSTTALTAALPPPVDPYMVTVLPREEYGGASWEFNVTEGKSKFNLIIG